MREIKIRVDENPIDKSIGIMVSGSVFQVNTFFDTTTVNFFLTPDLADKLAFHIQSILQDQDIRREESKLKAGMELREMSKK